VARFHESVCCIGSSSVVQHIRTQRLITLRAELSGAVYCYRSCLCVCNGRAGDAVCCWICYHDNSKLRA